MQDVRLIIAGSRGFNDYNLLKNQMGYLLRSENNDTIEIVSGGANGADKLGERFAKEKGFPIKYFLPDWGAYGKQAGYLRNKQMAEYATHCICFWDGQSKGTKLMIDLAERFNLKGTVVNYLNMNLV